MRYYIGFLLAIGLVIILILLLFAGGGKSHKTKKLTPPKPLTLSSLATTDAAVSVTIDGPINAVSLHEAIQITVSSFEANIEEFSGYDHTVVNSESFANNQSAYFAFLSALSIANFTAGNKSAALSNDTGRCPTGTRYDYRITQDGQSLEHFWSTSCGTATFLGRINLTNQLFRAQIPSYSKFTRGINL
jgi:hypothetical protein